MAEPLKATTVIRGGLIIDGTGGEPYVGDIAIEGETICAIGKDLKVKGVQREVDATGMMVAPGWIDVHTHYDAQATWDPMLSPSAQSGVTTAIMGNCGVGFAPCQKELRGFLVELMEAVEDIPGTALHEGIKWEWETFPEYLDALAKNNYACDVAVMIGHSGVRTWVLGKRASLSDRPGGPLNDPVTDKEISSMSDVVKEAVAAGALGFSTSRLLLHRDKHGILTPGCLAATKELTSIGRAIAEGGGGVIELSTDFTTYDDVPYHQMKPSDRKAHYDSEMRWMEQIFEEHGSKVPVTFGTNADGCFQHKELAEKAKLTGGKLACQIQTRPQSLHMSLDATTHPFLVSKTFRQIRRAAKGDKAAMRAEMSKPSTKAMILQDMSEFKPVTDGSKDMQGAGLARNAQGVTTVMWMLTCQGMYPWQQTYEPKKETRVVEIAKREGRAPLDVAYDLLVDNKGPHAGVLWRALFGYEGNNDKILSALQMEHVIPGFDDAGAHCSVLTDATAPTHLISYYCRDRAEAVGKPLMAVQRAVQVLTSEAAELFGLPDRGVLKPGKRADINVMDPKELDIKEPRYVNDLPKNAGRWLQESKGYRMTLTRGVVTFENEQHTGAFPGRLVRNPNAIGLHNITSSVAATRDMSTTLPELDLSDHAVAIASADTAGFSGVARAMRKSEETAASATRSKL